MSLHPDQPDPAGGRQSRELVGLWYEPIDNPDGLNVFERMDVALRADEQRNTHSDLLASSRQGIAVETKIRVHILYEGD